MARIPAAERSAELVAAAVHVIAAHGVDGATTRRIAEEANAPLATLHYCFSSKEVLFSAVFDYVAAQYREVLVRSDVHGDLETTARGLMRGVLEWYLENREFCAAIVELISWAKRQEGAQAEMVYNEASATIRTILENDATASGRTVAPDTLDELTYVVTALSDGFALNWLVFDDRAAARRQIDLVLGALDVWMAANLGAGSGPATALADVEPAQAKRSLVSWVSVS